MTFVALLCFLALSGIFSFLFGALKIFIAVLFLFGGIWGLLSYLFGWMEVDPQAKAREQAQALQDAERTQPGPE